MKETFNSKGISDQGSKLLNYLCQDFPDYDHFDPDQKPWINNPGNNLPFDNFIKRKIIGLFSLISDWAGVKQGLQDLDIKFITSILVSLICIL